MTARSRHALCRCATCAALDKAYPREGRQIALPLITARSNAAARAGGG